MSQEGRPPPGVDSFLIELGLEVRAFAQTQSTTTAVARSRRRTSLPCYCNSWRYSDHGIEACCGKLKFRHRRIYPKHTRCRTTSNQCNGGNDSPSHPVTVMMEQMKIGFLSPIPAMLCLHKCKTYLGPPDTHSRDRRKVCGCFA